MYEKNLVASSFKSNFSHLDTCMHFKMIADEFQQLPVGHLVVLTLDTKNVLARQIKLLASFFSQ